MKRFHARARGRGGRIMKPFSNQTVVVREAEERRQAPGAAFRSSVRSAPGMLEADGQLHFSLIRSLAAAII
jgi:hypothetical protein